MSIAAAIIGVRVKENSNDAMVAKVIGTGTTTGDGEALCREALAYLYQKEGVNPPVPVFRSI